MCVGVFVWSKDGKAISVDKLPLFFAKSFFVLFTLRYLLCFNFILVQVKLLYVIDKIGDGLCFSYSFICGESFVCEKARGKVSESKTKT